MDGLPKVDLVDMLSFPPVLRDGGECGALLRELDWSANPLGQPETWPDELHVVVGLTLASPQPMLILWGHDQIALYNDGYAALCGHSHPQALGRPIMDVGFRGVGSDIWNRLGPIIDAAGAGSSTSAENVELTMVHNGYPEQATFTICSTPLRNRLGEVLGVLCACTEATAAVAMRRAERIERRGFLQAIESMPGAIALLSGPDHVFHVVNADYRRLVGHRDVIGKPVREAWPEVVGQGLPDILDRVYRTGDPHVGRRTPVALKTGPDAASRVHLLDFLYQPIRDDDGAIDGIIVHACDVTRQVDEERKQQMLHHELGHRLKNQLAMVQAIINQTLRSAKDLPSAGQTLSERIRVLAGTHDMLIEGRAKGTTVRDIIARTLALHDDRTGTRLCIDGPDLNVASRPTLSLALILHELSTNATKYGALSRDTGSVSIQWQVVSPGTGPQQVVLTWTEQGGPAVTAPQDGGAGTNLIRAGLSGTTSCDVVITYRPEGLQCRITADRPGFQNDD